MLKKIRRVLAAVVIVLLTLLFLDFTGIWHLWFGWLARIQLIPAILAANVLLILALGWLTLLFGRIYCSVICPLGVLQDGVSYLSGKRKGRKNRFRYSPAKSWLRYGILALFIAGLLIGIPVVITLLDPYAAYGRIASNLFAPVYRLGNNGLAWLAERADSYAFYSTEVWIRGGLTLGVAVVTFGIVAVLAWKNGRTYCNTICPVGTLLGFVSRYSTFKPTFDREKCTQCGLCERGCKASCIDSKQMTIDQSRCVTCFNCMEKCRFGAMRYIPGKAAKSKTESAEVRTSGKGITHKGNSLRNFFSTVGLLTITHAVKGQQLQVDGGLADIEDKKAPDRQVPVVPPGAQGHQHMKAHCTACQLCVSACPHHILRPSAKFSTFMQPEMSFERGYCRPECTECSQVCPNKAIKPVTTAEKSAISIGQAVWIRENCLVDRDGVKCNSCERHCPTGAIIQVALDPAGEKSLKIPAVDKELCIGCGACEHFCPSRPYSAIYVEGNHRHRMI